MGEMCNSVIAQKTYNSASDTFSAICLAVFYCTVTKLVQYATGILVFKKIVALGGANLLITLYLSMHHGQIDDKYDTQYFN